jgi:hypothetical protein
MILVLGHHDDSLVKAVRNRLTGDGRPVLCLDEQEVCSKTSFAFHQNRTRTDGYLEVDGTRVRLDEISSALVRLPRMWWPDQELDMQDQMFVYHETSAAWFALLTSLACPVVNRFDLAWWVNDITYPDALVHDLGRRLKLHTRIDSPADALPPRIIPKMPDPYCTSVYVAGTSAIPRESTDRRTGIWVTANLSPITIWQRENGVALCRLDFDREEEELHLRHVEIFPVFSEESPALVQQIAAATVEMLA